MTSFIESALAASPRPGKRLGLGISQDAVAQVVDSAFAAQSPGLIQAAADYAELRSATKAELTAAKADILKSLSGGKVITDKPWTVCPKSTNGAAATSTGTVEARVLNGIVSLRGDVTLANPLPSTDSWVTVRELPAGFPAPDFTIAVAINGLVSGTSYAPAGVRIAGGSLMAISTSATAVKGFNFNGLMYQAF